MSTPEENKSTAANVRPAVDGATTGRLGPHAIAALFVILIAAFGVFCRYYPWKLPPAQAQEQARSAEETSAVGPAATDKRAGRARNQKAAARLEVPNSLSPSQPARKSVKRS
jgi:hypothetical protein